MRYIGSKQLLLKKIEEILNKHVTGDEEIFLDLFAGTNTVGNYFKKDYTIYSNDILYFSYVHARAIIQNNDALIFSKLKKTGINNPLDYLQEKADILEKSSNNYYEKSYTPTGGSMYFSVDNGKKIDFIRECIEEWKYQKLLTDGEYFYLLATLIQSIPYISNITGTYGAFLKHWDKRALKQINLKPLEIINNSRSNIAFNENANKLVKKVEADIVYIDTPYNNRQYASNYHVLENIARNSMPELKGKTRIFDWSNLKSDYSTRSNALDAMEDLVKNIRAPHVIVSYNDEGIIQVEELERLFEKYAVDGRVEVEYINYRKYKSKVASKKEGVSEIIFYFKRTHEVKKKNLPA